MTRLDDIALVVEMAATVEDRTRKEWGALKRVAEYVDKTRGRKLVTNMNPVKPYLLDLVSQERP